jgi:hypothetical protein
MPRDGVIMRRAIFAIAVLISTVALVSCRTEYRPYGERPVATDDGSIAAVDGRRVYARVDRAFYSDPPDCVVILSTSDKRAAASTTARIENAIARHLRDKVPRVIGPLQRERTVRRLALDLNHAGDRRRFAEIENCGAFLRWRTLASSNGYFLVWSHRDFGLDVEIFSDSNQTLWKASHIASRADGNLPLSFLSAPIAIYEAGRFSTDQDILPSMIDDTLRRLVTSLPDIR